MLFHIVGKFHVGFPWAWIPRTRSSYQPSLPCSKFQEDALLSLYVRVPLTQTSVGLSQWSRVRVHQQKVGGQEEGSVCSPLPKATVPVRWPLFKVYHSHQALVTATPFGLFGQALGILTIVLRLLGWFPIPSSSLNPDHISLNKPLTIFSSITYFGMCHLLLPGTLTDKHHAYLLTAF